MKVYFDCARLRVYSPNLLERPCSLLMTLARNKFDDLLEEGAIDQALKYAVSSDILARDVVGTLTRFLNDEQRVPCLRLMARFGRLDESASIELAKAVASAPRD